MSLKIFRHIDAQIPKNHIWIIGNFDGLHKGHDALISKAKNIAQNSHKKIGLLSFTPHPRQFFDPNCKPINIMQRSEKIRLLQKMGLHYFYLHPFNQDVASISAMNFCQKIKRQLDPSDLIIGYDFHFGHNRSGTPQMLNIFCQENNINCYIIPPQYNDHGVRYASSIIRQFLAQGDIQSVKDFINHPYVISGRVRHGKKLARQLGFPTANIHLKNLYLPKFGVYHCTIVMVCQCH